MKNKYLPAVVCLGKVIWKKIEGYINAYASENGDIAIYNSNLVMIKCPIFKWKTSKGNYNYVRVLTDDIQWVIKPVHRLVCLAFHGKPNNVRIVEPNHKDGDKLNNKPSNLEWLTRADNVQHAYDSGLCTQGLRIDVINIKDKTVEKYNSLSKLAREWNISRKVLKSIIVNHRENPYKDKWLFVLDDSLDKKIKRHQRKSVVFKDYVNDKIYICEDCEKAEFLTKVKSGTISNKLMRRNKTIINGFIFINMSEYDIGYEWPEVSNFEIEKSITKYTSKK